MVWLIVAFAVILLGAAAVAASGKLGAMPEADNDVYGPTLPDGQITAQFLRQARFGITFRGYSQAQVDALLNRLADQLDPAQQPATESEIVVSDAAVVTNSTEDATTSAAEVTVPGSMRDNGTSRTVEES